MDETASDAPVRDNPTTQDVWKVPFFVQRMSRTELEENLLCQKEEIGRLKQEKHQQEDDMKKLCTKLMRSMKDRQRMADQAAGAGGPLGKRRHVEIEEVVEELQEKVQALQIDKEKLTRRLLLVKQQMLTSQKSSPYAYVQPRVNAGSRRGSAKSPTARPKSKMSLDTAAAPQCGQSQLEEAREEIRNLENEVETQRSNYEELRAELQRKEEEHEKQVTQIRQKQIKNMRSHVDENIAMIKLQMQLTEKSKTVSELEELILRLQEREQALKFSLDVAVEKVEELTAELKEERRENLELKKRDQSFNVSRLEGEISELEQERDLLKANNNMLLDRAMDVTTQQSGNEKLEQLQQHVSHLETALKADLEAKNHIMDSNLKLSEENQRLLQQQQEKEKEKEAKKSSTEEYDHSELTEALLMVKSRRAQNNADLDFLNHEENADVRGEEERAAQAEELLELQEMLNTRMNAESKADLHPLKSFKAQPESRVLGFLQAHGSRNSVPGSDGGVDDRGSDESLQLKPGEDLLELQVQRACLSPSILQELGETEPKTFCSYYFYGFSLHNTDLVPGACPWYGYKSRYVVSVDEQLLKYLREEQLTVQLNHAQGVKWKAIAKASIPLRALTEHDAPLRGSATLIGVGEDSGSVGSLDYCLKMKIPINDIITQTSIQQSQAVLMEKKEEGAKKVSFVEATEKEASDDEEEEDEDITCLSTGQLVTVSSQFAEELMDDSSSIISVQSDSDDCIVQSSSVRKPSVRLGVLSLSLRKNSSVSLDPNVVCLYVDFSFLGLPREETPLSLPKPSNDGRANYNYSMAIAVDAEENAAQRAHLRKALLGNDPATNRVSFTVVSEPPPDEQQDKECEEVGTASIQLSELLEKAEDLMEASLEVLSVKDDAEVIGFLDVSVEGLHILRSIMDDDEDDECSSSSSSSSPPKT